MTKLVGLLLLFRIRACQKAFELLGGKGAEQALCIVLVLCQAILAKQCLHLLLQGRVLTGKKLIHLLWRRLVAEHGGDMVHIVHDVVGEQVIELVSLIRASFIFWANPL